MQFIPHSYQQYAIRRICQERRVGLFLGMGLGKTVITLTAVNELRYDRWEVGRCLIVAPKKVAEATWSSEARKWDHLRHLRINLVLGTARQREKALVTPGDIWVINRENVPWLADHYRHDWPFDMVVLDESSSFKNPQSARFRSLRRVLPKITRLVELTGTPTPNGLEDLWAQIYLLDQGERLGKTLTAYRDCYFTQDYVRPGQMYRTYSPKPGADREIWSAISDLCVSMEAKDYLTLPDYIENTVPVALDPAGRKAYDRLEREAFLSVPDGVITAGTAAVLNGKLLQLCSGAVYGETGPALIHNCKIEALLELVEQLHGEHALIFYWFRHGLDRLTQALSKTGLRVRLYQGPQDEADWNAGQVDLLLAHPASCAYGLNLQAGGRHLIWFEYPNWALELYQQANARLYRQGQGQPVICHHLVVQNSAEETMLQALHSKGSAQESLLSALKARSEQISGHLPLPETAPRFSATPHPPGV